MKGEKEREDKAVAEKEMVLIIDCTYWGSWGASGAWISSGTNHTLENRKRHNFRSMMFHLETHLPKSQSYQADMDAAL